MRDVDADIPLPLGATLVRHISKGEDDAKHAQSVESTIDRDNQPTSWAGSPTGSSGRVTAGTWTSVDVTPLVQAAAGGELTFGLSTTSTTNLSLGSRESLHKPQLVIATG